MKKNILSLFIFISSVSFSQTVKIISNTDIKEVKVYLNGAEVVREIKTAVEAGTTQLAIEGLSEFIKAGSITVTGTGDATLLSVVSQLDYLNSTKKSPRLRLLQDSLDEFNHSLDKLNDLSSVFLGEEEVLNANKSVGGANTGVDKDNLKEVLEFYREQMVELKVKLLENKDEIKKLTEHIQKLSKQVSSLSAEENKPTSTILISIDCKQRTNLSLELNYVVSNAGWTPQYDIRATDEKNNIQLIYKANVFQSTGEEWKDVKLKLSTANPTQNGTEPTLYPWYLNFYQPVSYVHPSGGGMQNEELKMARRSNAAATAPESESQASPVISEPSVTIDQNQLNIDFNIAISYSIPSDGKKYLVDIQTFSLPAIYTYSAIPKLDKDAFLLARITGWDDLNLLSGRANVYLNGSFVGSSLINTRSTNDTLNISLGRDRQIIITRDKKKELSSTKFIGNNTVRELNYLITVRNAKNIPVKITIEDQVPVSKSSDIEVKVIDDDGAEYSAETGKVKWNIDIPAGEVVSKKLNYSVKYPKNKTIEGL